MIRLWKNERIQKHGNQTAWDDSPLLCLAPETGPEMLGRTPPSAMVAL